MHPFHAHRQHKVEKDRVSHIAHRASGGSVKHPDEAEDKKLIRKMMAEHDREAEGGKSKHRRDRVARAHGGKVKGKGNGATVNVIVGGQHAQPPAPPMMPPMGAAPAGPPPGPPPGLGAPAPGAGPMMPQMRARGGAIESPKNMKPKAKGGMCRSAGGPVEAPEHAASTYRAKGGKVKSGPAWEEGRKAGTQVQHEMAKEPDIENIHRGRVVTYARGGRVESDYKVDPASKLPGGSGGGAGRRAKAKKYGFGHPMKESNGAR